MRRWQKLRIILSALLIRMTYVDCELLRRCAIYLLRAECEQQWMRVLVDYLMRNCVCFVSLCLCCRSIMFVEHYWNTKACVPGLGSELLAHLCSLYNLFYCLPCVMAALPGYYHFSIFYFHFNISTIFALYSENSADVAGEYSGMLYQNVKWPKRNSSLLHLGRCIGCLHNFCVV